MLKNGQMVSLSMSVSELNSYLRSLIESDEILADVWVQGEVSNLSRPASGHIYFTLKDKTSSLRCVIWKSFASRININLMNGIAVEVHGSITVYEAAGQYQLSSNFIRLKGEGDLFQEFLGLKDKLSKEGLFDPERKKPLPENIRKVGIVTSLTGAALQDILQTFSRRNPMLDVVIAGSSVQGSSAPGELSSAINKLEDIEKLDLIIIARGGGSLEDLWAFNDEQVVRTIAICPIPIISGIGHETDFTLVDFVADERAPTPTGAAELATRVTKIELIQHLESIQHQLISYLESMLDQKRAEGTLITTRLATFSPIRKIQNFSQNLDGISSRLINFQNNRVLMERSKIHNAMERIIALDPIKVMNRGYAIVTRRDDHGIISSTKQVQIGDDLMVQVYDGRFWVDVKLVEI